MADPVALTSVVTSGLVAVAGLGVSYRLSREQRHQQARLVRHEQAWRQESEGMADLVATCRSLIDTIDRPGSIDVIEELDLERGDYESTVHEHLGVSEIGVRVGDVVQRLNALVPAVELYAAAECRSAFEQLRRLLRDSGFDPRAADRLAAIRRSKAAAVDSKDYRSAATARRLERELLENARSRLDLDLDQARAAAALVVSSARDSLHAVPESAGSPLRS